MAQRSAAARVAPETANLRVYRDPEVVAHYASLDYLTPCERFLFDTYLRPGAAILDLGVGGGRTTPYLSRKASHYVGVDYSQEMIHLCRAKFPQLEFRAADVSDLSEFPDGSFDSIVFAFNGLDCLLPAERRRQCLRECERVLRGGGVFIFSSHNPRSIVVRPGWNPKRLRAFARRLVPRPGILLSVVVGALTVAKSVQALARAITGSAGRIVRRLPTAAFWRGEGCVIESTHGGLMTHCGTPARAIAETSMFGFRFETLLGDDHPRRSHELVTDWYYYVFSKTGSSGGEPCA